MSAIIYKNIGGLVETVVENYRETREICVILDVEYFAEFLNRLLNYESGDLEFRLDSMCACEMFEDQLYAQKLGEPFMITIMKNGEIITERFHSEYEDGAYADIWCFIEEKYRSKIANFKPSHYSLFKLESE